MTITKKTLSLIVLFLATAAMAHATTFSSNGLHFSIIDEQAHQVALIANPDALISDYEGVVVIPDRVYYDGFNCEVVAIADSAFYSSRVTEVQIPNSVTVIGEGAFAYAEELTSITLPLGLEKVSKLMLAGTAITDIAIPEGVETIGWGAFQSCAALHTVFLPSTTTTIEAYAFNNCHNLYEIYCAALTPPNADAWAIFIGLQGIDLIVQDEETVALYEDDTVWGNSETFTVYPNEDISVSASLQDMLYNQTWMRVDLGGGNLAYRIYDDDGLIAVTAAQHYYFPIGAIAKDYEIVPTTYMGFDADPLAYTTTPTAADDLLADLPQEHPIVYASQGTIYVAGDNYGKWLRVYDIYGNLYYQRPAITCEVRNLPRNRVYIVIIGNYVQKVFV